MPETRNGANLQVSNLAPTVATVRGYRTDTATAAARSLNSAVGGIPANASYAVIQVTGGVVNWRDDGVDPTAAAGGGMPLGYDATLLGTSTTLVYDADLAAFKYILRAGSPRLDVAFYS